MDVHDTWGVTMFFRKVFIQTWYVLGKNGLKEYKTLILTFIKYKDILGYNI